MSEPTPSLLRQADRWSRAGLYAGIGCEVALLAADITGWATGQPDLIPRSVHAILIVGLNTLVGCCVMVMVGTRLARWQRRILDRLDAMDPELDPGRLAPVVGGLSPDIVSAARRIASRLDHAA